MDMPPLERLIEIYGRPEKNFFFDCWHLQRKEEDVKNAREAAIIDSLLPKAYFYLGMIVLPEGAKGTAHRVMDTLGYKGIPAMNMLRNDGFSSPVGSNGAFSSASSILLKDEEDRAGLIFCAEYNIQNLYKKVALPKRIFLKVNGLKKDTDLERLFEILVISEDKDRSRKIAMEMQHSLNLAYENNPLEEGNLPFRVKRQYAEYSLNIKNRYSPQFSVYFKNVNIKRALSIKNN
jgi:hypothetical protein